MELKKRLGKRVQELRLKYDMKQSELAEKVGIATKHQSCIETGKNYPSAELVEKYAQAFNTDISEIFSISHIKGADEMIDEIIKTLKSSPEEKIRLAYRLINCIFK